VSSRLRSSRLSLPLALFVIVIIASAFTINRSVSSNADEITSPTEVDLLDVVPINYGAAEAAVATTQQAQEDFIEGLEVQQYLDGLHAADVARQAAEAEAAAQAAAAAAAKAKAAAPKAPAPVRNSAPAPASTSGFPWDRLAQCESGGDWHIHTSNGFSGGLQFVNSTWLSNGGGAYAPQAWQASREQQIAVAERVLSNSGPGAWPACTSKLGLR
jgi:pyruvate/2-oxoglutarate dehydrogenase complex dihydrolipoamide acyltransferase (E2) component